MFCPQCKAEYRQGFYRCADCDVDLVHALPAMPPNDPKTAADNSLYGWESELRVLWKGHDQAICVEVCRDLMKGEIPYRVAQIAEGRDAGMNVKWLYQVGVSQADYERARKLAGIGGDFENADDHHDEPPTTEDVDESESLESLPIPVDDSTIGRELGTGSYLDPWYPEDAATEVWSGVDDGSCRAIEMSLKENLIRCRVDASDSVNRIFVLPIDETHAREIVHEIVEGVPPE